MKKTKRIWAMILSIVIVLGMTPFVSVAETGEDLSDIPAGAIPLSSVDDLAMIGYEYSLDSYFYLTQDIDMTAATSRNGDYYNDGLGWLPIGSASTPFTGTFDGRNHTITGMNINRPEEARVGFISVLSGTVKNVKFKDCYVSAKPAIGIIVGEGKDEALLENCHTIGGELNVAPNCEYDENVGGLAGRCGTVKACSNRAKVEATASATKYCGGVVGRAQVVEKCSNFGEVKFFQCKENYSYSKKFGGIAGRVEKYIEDSVCVCFIGSWGTSGIVGECDKISRCYFQLEEGCVFYGEGIVSDSSWFNVDNCFSINAKISSGKTNIRNSYSWDSKKGTGIIYDSEKNATDVTSRQMKYASYFKDFDFENVWTMDGNEDYMFPELRSVPMIFTKTLTGISMATDPTKLIYIENLEDLDLSGSKLRLSYDNETTEKIDITPDMISGYDKTKVGTQVITVSYGGFTTTFKVTVLAKSVSSIELTTKPATLTYLEDRDVLDVSGGVVTRYFNNGTSDTVELKPEMVSGFDNTKVGTQTLTITINGKTATFDVEIIEKTVVAVSVATKPTKTEYLEGKDNLDLSGGQLRVTYDNGKSKLVSFTDENVTVTGFNKNKPGTQTLTVYLEGFTAKFDVTVIAKSVKNILISSLPNALSYLEGTEKIDVAGGFVKITYNNGTTETVPMTEDMVSGFDLNVVGSQVVTVTIGGKTAVFEIDVVTKTATSVNIETLPAKLTYREAKDALNISGGSIRVNYNNGKHDIIPMTAEMVTGFDNTKIGKQTLTVAYSGFTVEFEIEIIAKRVASISVDTLPEKTEYVQNFNELNVDGGRIVVYYDNGTSEVINMTLDMISDFDNTKVGEQTLTVTYKEKTATFKIKVLKRDIVRAEIIKMPNRSVFSFYEFPDITGVEIKGYFNDGTTEIFGSEKCYLLPYDYIVGETEFRIAVYEYNEDVYATCKVTLINPVLCDTDGDGAVDITDAMKIFYHVAKKEELPAELLPSCDINDDGTVDISDAMKVFYFVAKKIPSLKG